MPESVSLATLLDAHHSSQMENAHTAIPCKVVSYNAADNTVAAQPLVKRPGFAEDGTTKHEEIPTYPHVPVAFPRAGNFVVYLPVQAGSYGTLVFFDMSPGEALSTGQLSEPQDVSRHSGGYCFFLPGVYPFSSPIGDNPSNGYVGLDGNDAQVHFTASQIKVGKNAVDHVMLSEHFQTLLVGAFNALATALNGAGTAPLLSNALGAGVAALATTLSSGWAAATSVVTKAE